MESLATSSQSQPAVDAISPLTRKMASTTHFQNTKKAKPQSIQSFKTIRVRRLKFDL